MVSICNSIMTSNETHTTDKTPLYLVTFNGRQRKEKKMNRKIWLCNFYWTTKSRQKVRQNQDDKIGIAWKYGRTKVRIDKNQNEAKSGRNFWFCRIPYFCQSWFLFILNIAHPDFGAREAGEACGGKHSARADRVMTSSGDQKSATKSRWNKKVPLCPRRTFSPPRQIIRDSLFKNWKPRYMKKKIFIRFNDNHQPWTIHSVPYFNLDADDVNT